MKAVIWTDTIQTFAMVAGGLGAMIRALMNVGGLENALAVAHFGKRLNFWKYVGILLLVGQGYSNVLMFDVRVRIKMPVATKYLV